jgi:hypothetical protein
MGSVIRSAQPPPGHIIAPAAHMQTPDVHVPPVPQLRPHMPQFIGSVATFTHVAGMPQTIWAPEHEPHAPPVQTIPAVHACPHDPQLAESVAGSTHAPPHIVRGLVHPPVPSDPVPSPFAVESVFPSVAASLCVPLDPLLHAASSASVQPTRRKNGLYMIAPET